jgi:TRAP-type C4-dicarboxylate transport system substrate-binding protein
VISESVFKAQKPDVQKAIIDAGAEATEHSYKYLLDTETKIKADLTAKGMQIVDPENGEKEWIAKATTTVWPKFYKSIGGKPKLDQILKTLGR